MSMNAGAHTQTHNHHDPTAQAAIMASDNGTGPGSAVPNQPTSASVFSSTRKGPSPHVKHLDLHKNLSFTNAVAASTSPSRVQSSSSASFSPLGAMPRSARAQLLAGLRTTPRSNSTATAAATATANVTSSQASPPPSAGYEHEYYNQHQHKHLNHDNSNANFTQFLHATKIQARIRAAQAQAQLQLLGLKGQFSPPDTSASYDIVSRMSPQIYSSPEHVLAPPAVDVPLGADGEPANRQLHVELLYLAAQQQRLQQQLLSVTAAAQQIQNISALSSGAGAGMNVTDEYCDYGVRPQSQFGSREYRSQRKQKQQRHQRQRRNARHGPRNNVTPIADHSLYFTDYNPMTVQQSDVQVSDVMEQESDLSWEKDMHDIITHMEDPTTFYDDLSPLDSGLRHTGNMHEQDTFGATSDAYVPSKPMSSSRYCSDKWNLDVSREPIIPTSPAKRMQKRPPMLQLDHNSANFPFPSATPATTTRGGFMEQESSSPATCFNNRQSSQTGRQPQIKDSRDFAMQQRRLAVNNLRHARMERHNGGHADSNATQSLAGFGSITPKPDADFENMPISGFRRDSQQSGGGSGTSSSGSMTPASENGLPFSSSESSSTESEPGESGTRLTSTSGSSYPTPVLSSKPSLGSIRAAVSGTIGSERKENAKKREREKGLASFMNSEVERVKSPFASSSSTSLANASMTSTSTTATARTSTSSPSATSQTTTTDDNDAVSKFAGLNVSEKDESRPRPPTMATTTPFSTPFNDNVAGCAATLQNHGEKKHNGCPLPVFALSEPDERQRLDVYLMLMNMENQE